MKLYNKVSMQWLVRREHAHSLALPSFDGWGGWHKKQTRFRQAHQGVIAWVNGE